MKQETSTISNIRDKSHTGVDTIMDKAEDIQESGKDKMAYVRDKATMMKENVDGYIRTNPEKSLLIAVGFGIISGVILANILMHKRT